MPVPIFSVYLGLILHATAVFGADLPCAQRETEFGFICVCNSSYCDTVERPSRLAKDQYHLYITGQLSPGFTHSTGTFLHTDSESSSIVFNVDSNLKYQEILGFGGSFTDTVGIVINSLPQEAQNKLMESYFSVEGIEYSAGRVAMAGSDFSARIYTYDDKPDDQQLTHFSLQQEDFLYKIPLIQKAINLSPHDIRLIASPFTAPPWMKTNGKFESGYIKKQYMDVWAKYFVKFLDSYAEHDIRFWHVTEGNEVGMPYMTKQALPIGNLGWPLSDAYFVKHHLGPQLRASNHSHVKYLPLDDQRNFAPYWMKKLTSDPEVSDMVAGLALHWYWDWMIPVSWLDDLHTDHPDKLILYTESSINIILFGGQSVQLGDWERASLYFYNIIENVNHWTNLYLDWNLVLDTEGGPALDIAIDAAIIVNASSQEFYKNPMFYAMGTFSKFIPPGSYRVNVTSNLNMTSPQDPDIWRGYLQRLGDLVGPTPAPLPTFPPFPVPTTPKTISCLATANPDNSTTVIVFNSMDEQMDVTVVDATAGRIATTIPAKTVHTFIYWPDE